MTPVQRQLGWGNWDWDVLRVLLIVVTFFGLLFATFEWPIVFPVFHLFTLCATFSLAGRGQLGDALVIVAGGAIAIVVLSAFDWNSTAAGVLVVFAGASKIVQPWLSAIDWNSIPPAALSWLRAVDWTSLALFAVLVVPIIALIYLGKLMNKLLGISAALDRVEAAEQSAKRARSQQSCH